MVKADMQRLAAAKALEWGKAKGTVASVKIEGTTVALADAQKALDEVNQRAIPDANWVDRFVDKVDTKLKTIEELASSKPAGKKIVDMLNQDHEKISKKVEVQVSFSDGRTEKVMIEVVDVRNTVLFNRLSAAANFVATWPVVGPAAAFLTAIAESSGAKIAEWRGNPEVAEALQRAAVKQWVLASVSWVPGIGGATGAMAVVRDWHDQRDVRIGPPVSVIA